MNPAGTLATGIITMPASPSDGMTITFSSSQQITALTLNGNTGQTVVGAVTFLSAKTGVSYVYRLASTNWFPTTAVPVFPSMVRLNTANGLGSTNTTVRRFTNVVTNQGSDITYADSATLGASFTINTAGVYSINYSDAGASGTAIGITLNCTQNSATCENLTDPSQLLIGGVTPANGQAGYPSWTGQLAAGSVIRASLGTNGTTYPKTCTFTITRIA
jgi:hypothetical protein